MSGVERSGSVLIKTLPHPMRNGSCDVVLMWEAVRRPVKVCEGGGWYSAHKTDTAWFVRSWMQHKSRPGSPWPSVSDEAVDDLDFIVARMVRAAQRRYGLTTPLTTRKGEEQ